MHGAANQLTMNKPDFEKLNKKYPNQNWKEIYQRMIEGKDIPPSLRIAINLFTPKEN